jgi:oligoribonuclease NrnB/cAMP/cGMP phosphodiesterase (DHH superfamily)
MITDFSYKDPENLKLIQNFYPDVKIEDPLESSIGLIAKKISSTLIYFSNNLERAYDLILNKELKKLEKYHSIIQEELEKFMKKFKTEALYNPEKDIYYFYFKSRYNITSLISSIISVEKPDSIFIFVSDSDSGYVKISFRNQSKRINMNELIKEMVSGLDDATGSGHAQASGGRFMKKDLEEFRERVMNC